MSLNRREFIKLTGLWIGGMLLSPGSVWASTGSGWENAVAMLYDTTKCIGCRACQNACKDWNGIPAEPDPKGLYDAPMDLTADTWTIIKLYQRGGESSFIKHQCMHCIKPACVSVCPVGALRKTAEGPVVYDDYKCIGCRYCMMACPFRIPKFEWDTPLPLIRKCTFCADRLALGMEPACTAACPTGALIFGRRSELLGEAHQRIQANPGRYVNHVYGEHEIGGTSALYLSHVPFEMLGFPTLGTRPNAASSEAAMIATPGVIVGAVGILSGFYWFTQRRVAGEGVKVPRGKEE